MHSNCHWKRSLWNICIKEINDSTMTLSICSLIQIVPNEHEFPGHIACDEASNSEIVVPIFLKKENQEPHVVGVLDLDSKELNTFDKEDQEALEKIVEHLVNACDWSNLLEWK